MSTSSLSYRLGEAIGTVTREFLRAVQQPRPKAIPRPHLQHHEPVAPHPSGDVLEYMCQIPAIARLKKVNLAEWYEQNTRECAPEKPKRQRSRKRKEQVELKVATSGSAGTHLKLGSLDALISPVEPMPLTC